MSGSTAQKITPKNMTVRARGLSLHVTRWHSKTSSNPLLFLNGIGADAKAAAPLLRRITGREVWTIDMPGTGASPDCFWPYSAHSMALSIMDAVSQIHDGPIDLAGFSWGGALAQQIAGQFPDHIGKLILLATSSQMGGAEIGWGAAFDRDIQKNSLRMPAASPLGLTYQSFAMTGWSSDALWPRIAQRPILVLSGEQDQVVRASECQKLADNLGAAHISISGGHLFPFTKAQETADIIMAFLTAQKVEPA